MRWPAVFVAILLFIPTPAAAVVATCGQTWVESCDPYTGQCFTVPGGANWVATHNGVVQPQCATDPTACWLAQFTECSTLPAPVNPAAVRVCPVGAACADSPLTSIPGYPISIGQLPGHAGSSTVQDVFECHAMDFNVFPNVDLGPLPSALTCLAIAHYPGECPFPPHGQFCGAPYKVGFSVGKFSTTVYEPPPVCAWDIRPAPQASACVMPIPPWLAVLKLEDAPGSQPNTQRTGTFTYSERLYNEAQSLMRTMKSGALGAPTTAKYSAASSRWTWLMTLYIMIATVLSDPPNPDYQFLPGPVVLPALVMPAPDATMTATQIQYETAWLGKVREASQYAAQLGQTIDNLAGALVAAQANVPGAAAWVRRLALHADSVSALMAAKGSDEVVARGPVVSTATSYPVAAACLTPTDAVATLRGAVLGTQNLYAGSLAYARTLGACTPASTWPGWLGTTAAEHQVDWNRLVVLGLADRLCTGAGYCSTLTVPTLTAPTGTISSTTTPSYAWTGVDGATYYFLWVNGPDGTVRIQYWYTAAQAGCATAGPCSATPAVSVGSGQHTWWVQAWSPSDGYGPFSGPGSFVVDTQLIYPAGTGVAATPTYTWHPTPDATYYYLWVNDPTAAPKVGEWAPSSACVGAVCTWTPSTPLALGASRWWVHPWNASGYLPWSVPLDFTR